MRAQQLRIEAEQIKIEAEQIRSETEQIKNEADQIKNETEQLKRESAKLRQLNARGRELLSHRGAALLSARVQLDPSDELNRARLNAYLALLAEQDRIDQQEPGAQS
jgi:hypothetical protein